jgi:hypothetical protein
MPLFQLRHLRASKAEAAGQGKTLALTDGLPKAARTKIVFAMMDNVPAMKVSEYPWSQVTFDTVESAQTSILTREWGRARLASPLRQYVSDATDAECLDIIESWIQAVGLVDEQVRDGSLGYVSPDYLASIVGLSVEPYRRRINEVLDDHDVAWQLVGAEMMPRSSLAMHATVVEPVFALTTGDARLGAVEKAYQAALRELKPGGDPPDAITDAGTALQEMLLAAGANGAALGALLADARRQGLLGPKDSDLVAGIEQIGVWVAAERNERGDAHRGASPATKEDAWLVVRVAGALILRLAAGGRR